MYMSFISIMSCSWEIGLIFDWRSILSSTSSFSDFSSLSDSFSREDSLLWSSSSLLVEKRAFSCSERSNWLKDWSRFSWAVSSYKSRVDIKFVITDFLVWDKESWCFEERSQRSDSTWSLFFFFHMLLALFEAWTFKSYSDCFKSEDSHR